MKIEYKKLFLAEWTTIILTTAQHAR